MKYFIIVYIGDEMKIEKINNANLEKVIKFIKRLPMLQAVDNTLLENMQVLFDEDSVKGVVTYEQYEEKALIRYFIFQKDVDFTYLKEMLEEMFKEAKNKKIQKVISVVDQDDLALFFEQLNFEYFDIDKLFIDEISVVDNVPSASGLIYNM